MNYFTYPARFTPDPDDGGFVVTFRDWPEAVTRGDTIEECLSQAADCLGKSIAYRIDDNLEIPIASSLEAGEYLVPVPLNIARKARIYSETRALKLSIDKLASILGIDKQKIHNSIDPKLEGKILSVLKTNNLKSEENYIRASS